MQAKKKPKKKAAAKAAPTKAKKEKQARCREVGDSHTSEPADEKAI